MPNLLIAIPTYRFNIHAGVGIMLLKLGARLVGTGWIGRVHVTSTPLLSNARNQLTMEAMSTPTDWMLFIDSDVHHNWPTDIINMLNTGVERGAAVIAAPYELRNGTYPLDAKNEVRERAIMPTGMMAINIRWLKEHMPKPPWFTVIDHPGTMSVTGEDEWFCMEVTKRGGTILCDSRFVAKHEI